ncbi:MAG: hypothetical protein GF331_20785 [Chitinivibrionales bacterium]|nr:hypothetical protein [Chitinivibrionales bacterium]
MALHMDTPRDEDAAFRKRWRIEQLAVFGSVLRGDFQPDSDVDVLVRLDRRVSHTLFGAISHVQAVSKEHTTVSSARNGCRPAHPHSCPVRAASAARWRARRPPDRARRRE